jgi:hypothetical protein
VLDPKRLHENSKVARAKRVMAGITNATRFACDAKDGACPESFVTDRKLGNLMPIPRWLAPLESVLDGIPKWGQTRFLTYRLGEGGDKSARGGNKLRESKDLPHLPMGMLAQGDVLGADDPYFIKLPGPASLNLGGTRLLNPFRCPKQPGPGDTRTWRDCWGDPREDKNDTLKPSVWAMSSTDLRENGIHWRVVFPGEASKQEDRNVGLSESRTCLASVQGTCFFEMSVYVANVRIDPKDHNHPWPGLVPFPHFEPGDYAKDCAESLDETPGIAAMAGRRDDFNQPSTWVLLTKSADAFRPGPGQLNSRGQLTFSFGTSSETLDLWNGG